MGPQADRPAELIEPFVLRQERPVKTGKAMRCKADTAAGALEVTESPAIVSVFRGTLASPRNSQLGDKQSSR